MDSERFDRFYERLIDQEIRSNDCLFQISQLERTVKKQSKKIKKLEKSCS